MLSAMHCTANMQVLLWLQLRLMADVALVGLPNVGKSSLIAALTGARAQVGLCELVGVRMCHSQHNRIDCNVSTKCFHLPPGSCQCQGQEQTRVGLAHFLACL